MYDTLNRLFRYKAWANAALLDALEALGGDSPVTALAIRALSHTYVVDRIFAAHLRGARHGFTAANPEQQPALATLAAQLRSSDGEYVEYVRALGHGPAEARIDFTFTDGAPGSMTRLEMLMHVITHGVGHRGQVSAVMLLNGLTPPKDGLTTYLHEAEAGARRRARA